MKLAEVAQANACLSEFMVRIEVSATAQEQQRRDYRSLLCEKNDLQQALKHARLDIEKVLMKMSCWCSRC
jgi:hypothetical protein